MVYKQNKKGIGTRRPIPFFYYSLSRFALCFAFCGTEVYKVFALKVCHIQRVACYL